MGNLLTYCLKAAGEMNFGLPRQSSSRRQAMQSLLTDKDNPCVDGRRAATMPPQAVQPPSQVPPSPSSSSPSFKEKYTGPHGQPPRGKEAQRPSSFPFGESLRESVI